MQRRDVCALPGRRAVLAALAVATMLATAPSTAAAQAALRTDTTRVRFGVDGGLGFGVLTIAGPSNDIYFGALAATGRIGVQFGALAAIYYQMGGWALGRDATGGYAVTGVWSHTGNFDLTFGNAFQIGAGAGVDFVGGNFDVFPSFDTRVAFLIGTTGPGSRGAFAIGLKSHFAIDVSGPNVELLAIPVVFAGFELF